MRIKQLPNESYEDRTLMIKEFLDQKPLISLTADEMVIIDRLKPLKSLTAEIINVLQLLSLSSLLIMV